MVSGIGMAGIMPVNSGQTAAPESAEFMQTLETELGVNACMEAVQADGETAVALIPQDLSPELKAQLEAIVKNMMAQAEQQEENGGMKLLELLMKLLGKDTDEDKKEIPFDAGAETEESGIAGLLMELVANISAEQTDFTAENTETEPLAPVAGAQGEITAEHQVHEAAIPEVPAAEKTVIPAEAQINRFVLPIDAETAELVQPVKTAETAQPVFSEQTDAEYIAPTTPKETAVRPQMSAEQATVEQTAEKTLEALVRTISEATGRQTEIVVREKAPEQVQTVFAGREMPVKTQETDEELTQLMSGLAGKRTETETAVKMPAELMTSVYTAQNAQPAQPEAAEVNQPAEMQLAQAITANLTQDDGETTFTMSLKPRELGEVDVKIVAAEGKVTVELTVRTERTAEILTHRMENIQAALKENGVELEKYQVVYSPEETAAQHQDYNGSSRNPYGRQQEEKKDEDAPEFSQVLGEIAV